MHSPAHQPSRSSVQEHLLQNAADRALYLVEAMWPLAHDHDDHHRL